MVSLYDVHPVAFSLAVTDFCFLATGQRFCRLRKGRKGLLKKKSMASQGIGWGQLKHGSFMVRDGFVHAGCLEAVDYRPMWIVRKIGRGNHSDYLNWSMANHTHQPPSTSIIWGMGQTFRPQMTQILCFCDIPKLFLVLYWLHTIYFEHFISKY